MKSTFFGAGALVALTLVVPYSHAWDYYYPCCPPYVFCSPVFHMPLQPAPSPSNGGFYFLCPNGRIQGPNYCLRPPFNPIGGFDPVEVGQIVFQKVWMDQSAPKGKHNKGHHQAPQNQPGGPAPAYPPAGGGPPAQGANQRPPGVGIGGYAMDFSDPSSIDAPPDPIPGVYLPPMGHSPLPMGDGFQAYQPFLPPSGWGNFSPGMPGYGPPFQPGPGYGFPGPFGPGMLPMAPPRQPGMIVQGSPAENLHLAQYRGSRSESNILPSQALDIPTPPTAPCFTPSGSLPELPTTGYSPGVPSLPNVGLGAIAYPNLTYPGMGYSPQPVPLPAPGYAPSPVPLPGPVYPPSYALPGISLPNLGNYALTAPGYSPNLPAVGYEPPPCPPSTASYPSHCMMRGPRDFFMWGQAMEDQVAKERRPSLVP